MGKGRHGSELSEPAAWLFQKPPRALEPPLARTAPPLMFSKTNDTNAKLHE